eukprot:Pompholyxophrys_punicea_v1_NODE_443_length_1960_cov_8.955906.p2 type:complete len:124 gc:universal NODE_443_length_1960_cov_8.955906:1173-1544(+)
MLGSHNDVSTRILRENNYMVAFDRESLASKAAAEDIDYLNRSFFPLIEQLGRFYDASAPKYFRLLAVQEEISATSPLKLVKSAFTRWLSHDRVTEVLHLHFLAILINLQQESKKNGDATASGQ